jgi:TonB family protein
MVPQSQARKPRNSSKINLIISVTFHGVLVFVILYFAARGGMLGRQMQKMTVSMVKEKVEPKKEPEKKAEPPKVEEPKLTVAPKMTETATPPPPSTADTAPAAVAPPPVDVPAFAFDGGQQVVSADPVTAYKSLIQDSIMAKWNRPGDLADKDKDFAADIEVSVDSSGRLGSAKLTRSSGNREWDNSVKQAMAATADVGARPPKGFPSQVTVRFDVHEEQDATFQ